MSQAKVIFVQNPGLAKAGALFRVKYADCQLEHYPKWLDVKAYGYDKLELLGAYYFCERCRKNILEGKRGSRFVYGTCEPIFYVCPTCAAQLKTMDRAAREKAFQEHRKQVPVHA